MKTSSFLIFLNLFLNILILSSEAFAKHTQIDAIKKETEGTIRHLVEPLLEKYCHDQCKIMGVNVSFDLAKSEVVAPGFDEPTSVKNIDIEPTSAKIKLLIDDKVGPISRGKIHDLIQEYLDTLDYPVKIDTQIAHFPIPQGSETKIAELKQQVSKKFLEITEELLKQYCPQLCLLTDFEIRSEIINSEESQYDSSGEFFQNGDTALKINDISATLLMDDSLPKEEQENILQLAKLKTNQFKHVNLTKKSFRFPKTIQSSSNRALASSTSNPPSADSPEKTSSNATTTNATNNTNNTHHLNENNNSKTSETNVKQEKIEKIEKIERVENGDAVQAELQKFKIYGLVFACSVLAMLIFIAMSVFRPADKSASTIQRVVETLVADPTGGTPQAAIKSMESDAAQSRSQMQNSFVLRYEVERLLDELTSTFAQQPRVAKHVFTRVLTEEGIEVAAKYIHIFGESIVVDMLKDSSLQTNMNELMEFYAKNLFEVDEEEKLDLLKKLHNRTVAGKLAVLGSRSSHLFDYLAEMDGLQIFELIRNESLTVKSIVLTQCDIQKRANIFAQLDSDTRMLLLTELTRVDYLPKDYIFNVASALKRKRAENPRLNTEALPGSEVLISLLERTGHEMQKTVIKSLEISSPDSARVIKSKLVSIDTLKYLRDGQLLEVVLNLKHEELIQFLKGATKEIKATIFSKAPKELSEELEEELAQLGAVSRDTYQTIERKLLNRMKIMANEGQINLIETNERMFASTQSDSAVIQAGPGGPQNKNKFIHGGTA